MQEHAADLSYDGGSGVDDEEEDSNNNYVGAFAAKSEVQGDDQNHPWTFFKTQVPKSFSRPSVPESLG